MPTNKNKKTDYLKLSRSFIGVPDETVTSPELNALTVHSRWLYMILLTKFNRLNNRIKDEYDFTYKDLRAITGYDDRRLSFCIKELEAADFMDIVHGGKNNPSLYRPVLHWLC